MRITTGRQLRNYRRKIKKNEWELAGIIFVDFKDIINAEKNPNRKLTKFVQRQMDTYMKHTNIVRRALAFLKMR